MDELQCTCGQCGAVLRTNNLALAGEQAQCPRCGTVFVIPGGPNPGGPNPGGAVRATPAAPARRPVSAAPAPPLAVGQRVFARWAPDGFWYPATVRYAEPGEVMVKYDDGVPGILKPDEVREVQLAEGDGVQARWLGNPEYYPAIVRGVHGEKVQVTYDDGTQEATTVGMLRVIRREDVPWQSGDRVLAGWLDEPFFYPATVREVREDGFVAVAYDDGESAQVIPGRVLPLGLRVGDLVFARWQLGPLYYPARILRIDGETLRVRYEEDGVEEKTAVRYIRILPAAPA